VDPDHGIDKKMKLMPLTGLLVGDGFRPGRCAGNHREDASVTAEGLGNLDQIEAANSF
jgi:hypothetical protein